MRTYSKLNAIQEDAQRVAEAISSSLKLETEIVGETVAAMIVEPIQGEAGIVLPPQNYLKQLREICDRYGVLLIFDKIQTGMGRTGTLWACEGYDVVPDILVFGKAFGGGVMPKKPRTGRPNPLGSLPMDV